MKKCTLCVVLMISGLVFNTTSAQVKVCVFCASNVHEQPDWGPTGYDFVYYYYMPEMEVYYYVPGHRFIYQKKGVWITSPTLPARYAAYDLYKVYKVVINDDDNYPYLNDDVNRAQYSEFKKQRGQPVIRDSHDILYQKRKGVSEVPWAVSGV